MKKNKTPRKLHGPLIAARERLKNETFARVIAITHIPQDRLSGDLKLVSEVGIDEAVAKKAIEFANGIKSLDVALRKLAECHLALEMLKVGAAAAPAIMQEIRNYERARSELEISARRKGGATRKAVQKPARKVATGIYNSLDEKNKVTISQSEFWERIDSELSEMMGERHKQLPISTTNQWLRELRTKKKIVC